MKVKICGLTDDIALDSAVDSGADFIGLVFHPKSVRHLDIEKAASLSARVPDRVTVTALFVDPPDDYLARVISALRVDMIQLHGSEPPQRISEIRARFEIPVAKALKISEPEDLIMLGAFQQVADWLLFDAKPGNHDAPAGGNGRVFDWRLLKNLKTPRPWMLSGGINAGNVQAALDVLSPNAVDVSSGVESSPGVKDPNRIAEFIHLVKA